MTNIQRTNSTLWNNDNRMIMHSMETMIVQNSYNSIERILYNGFDTNYRGNYGTTILHSAVRYKKKYLVQLLLFRFNASPIVQDFLGKTAFFSACERGFIKIVTLFLDLSNNQTFINKYDHNGMTPLLIAYKNKNYPICKLLIRKGSDINASAFDSFKIPDRDKYTIFRDFVNIESTPITTPRVPRRIHRRIEFTTPSVNSHVSTPTATRMPRRIEFTPYVNTSQVPSTEEEKKEDPIPSYFLNNHINMMIELKKSCDICLEFYESGKVVIMKKKKIQI